MKTMQQAAAVLALFALCNNAFADRRSYVWTYEYMTMPKGTKEIEYYYTTKIPQDYDAEVNTMEHQVEFEYGITDYWDIALYQRLMQRNRDSESDTNYQGFKVRTRYRFGEKGQFLIDPLVYLEYKRGRDFSEPNEIEAKLILAKDIGDFNIAYNQILERDLESEGKTEHAYAFGINYKLKPHLSLGLEATGNYSEEKYYLGPTVSVVFGRMWLSCGIVRGLIAGSDDIQARVIVGIPF